jgi:hypothetical protein
MAPSDDDPYAVLGVPETATLLEIKHAYLRLARAHHPDRQGDAETFRQKTAAWEYLRDNHERDAAERRRSAERAAAEDLIAEREARRRAEEARLWWEREGRVRAAAEAERQRQHDRDRERQRVQRYHDAVRALGDRERSLHERGVPIPVARRITGRPRRAVGLALLLCAVAAVGLYCFLLVAGRTGAGLVELAEGIGILAVVPIGVILLVVWAVSSLTVFTTVRRHERRAMTPDELREEYLDAAG